MAAAIGSDRVLIARLDDIEWTRVGKHRGPGLTMKSLPFRDDGRGSKLWLSIAEMEDGWYSPRHRHNFDQIRYVLRGETGFTKWDLHAGECAYFPAGAQYGPQEQHGSASLFTLQFPGPDGQHYLTPEQVEDTVAKLRAEDPSFGEGGRGVDKQGRERDSYEIVWETHQRQPVEYPESEFTGPVLFDGDEPITDATLPGCDVHLIGEIESNGLQVLRVRARGSLEIAPASPSRSEFWVLESGAIDIGGDQLQALTVIQLQVGAPTIKAAVPDGATFMVLRLPDLVTN